MLSRTLCHEVSTPRLPYGESTHCEFHSWPDSTTRVCIPLVVNKLAIGPSMRGSLALDAPCGQPSILQPVHSVQAQSRRTSRCPWSREDGSLTSLFPLSFTRNAHNPVVKRLLPFPKMGTDRILVGGLHNRSFDCIALHFASQSFSLRLPSSS